MNVAFLSLHNLMIPKPQDQISLLPLPKKKKKKEKGENKPMKPFFSSL
jgi:hypothetical protein